MDNILITDIKKTFPPIQIELPTLGKFYPMGVLNPEANPKNISVGTLGIMDEFSYKDIFLLVSGKAIEQLITHLCGDQILVPSELCEIDVETILVAARMASYGPDLNLTHVCDKMVEKKIEGDDLHNEEIPCMHENKLLIDLHDFILRYENIKDFDMFMVALPKIEQKIYLKPTPYRTSIEVMRNVMGNRKKMEEFDTDNNEFILNSDSYVRYEELMGLSADLQIKTVLDCIWGVELKDGRRVEDPHILAAWIYELPEPYYNMIRNRVNDITNHFRQISLYKYKCGACGGDNEFNLNMNAEILFLVDSEVALPPSMISSDSLEKNKKPFRTPLRTSRR
jgi:hypothetical protein